MITLGVILLVTGMLLVAADTGSMSRRMPTQVLPRRFARYPIGAGLALVVAGLVVRATSS